MATINYDPRDGQGHDDDSSYISAFVEEPLGDMPFEGFASSYTDGIWFGYLALRKFPEFSRLVSMVDWETSEDGTEVRGTFEGWELLFVFADAAAELPVRVAMRDLADSPLGPAMMAHKFEFLEWNEYDGITCPRRVGIWYLGYQRSEEWLTTYEEVTLESIGPVMELSDRYGDYFTEVPDGVPVQVNDYMGIEFVWEDGEIVRKVDRERLSSLIGQPFFGSPLRRFVLMGAGLCVLAVAGWFVYRRSARTGGS